MCLLLYYPFINNVIELIFFHGKVIEIVLNKKIHFIFLRGKKYVCVHY